MTSTTKRLNVTVTRAQNKIVRDLINSQGKAFKNWIATAVEQSEFERAQKLVKELRELEDLNHIFLPEDCLERLETDKA